MSTGDEILPEHLNLPEAPESLAQIEQQAAQLIDNGSAAERCALKRLLESLTQTLHGSV
ncbi:hypothetical protein D3C81_2335180 [compost metagenome]